MLLPFCVGAARTLVRLLAASGEASTVWLPLLCGAACWVLIYAFLPRPMWLYVFGHELTHALAAWLCGGRVKRFKVSARGGHVVVSKSNWWVTLGPYFVPIYVVLVLVVFGLGHLLWGWGRHPEWLHLFLGAAYAFHVTLTWQVLRTRQTDITSQGWFFAAVIIFLGNAVVLMVGLPLLTGKVSLGTVIAWWLQDTAHVVQWLSQWV
ncbi:MAG: M50 family metallopeptidase [Limisphaera sp.]|nr:M50 family metallopeptidase [Limisphaera sp.]